MSGLFPHPYIIVSRYYSKEVTIMDKELKKFDSAIIEELEKERHKHDEK